MIPRSVLLRLTHPDRALPPLPPQRGPVDDEIHGEVIEQCLLVALMFAALYGYVHYALLGDLIEAFLVLPVIAFGLYWLAGWNRHHYKRRLAALTKEVSIR